MKALTRRLCLWVLFLAFANRTSADPKVFLDSIENGNDPKKISVTEWYIELAKLEHLPVYNPAADASPISIADAIKIARSQIDRGLTPESDVTLKTVELEQIDLGNSGETVQSSYVAKPTGKWSYKVTYSIARPDFKKGLYTYSMPIYVLTDGTVSERRERPQTEQERKENQQFIDQIEKEAIADKANKRGQ